MAPKGGGKNHTLAKPLEDSSMTCEESEDLSFQMPSLRHQFKWLVK